MAFETKVLLIAIGNMLLDVESVEKAYEYVRKMANAEGVLLESYSEAKAENEAATAHAASRNAQS